jgi:hypothetical protein
MDNVRGRYLFGSAWKVTGGGNWTVRERKEKGKRGKFKMLFLFLGFMKNEHNDVYV